MEEDTSMADGYDRYENEGAGGGSFVMGLLTGTVLGAGLGMLFAPKSGSDLRNQLSDHAGSLRDTASDSYRRASEAAGDIAEKGRGAYDKAKDAVSRGAEEAQRYARETTGMGEGTGSGMGSGGSATGSTGGPSSGMSGAYPGGSGSPSGPGSSGTGSTGGGPRRS